jgi:replicative DNA helicase
MTLTKNIHYSTDLEDAVLGAFLLEKTAFGRCYGLVDSNTFYSTGNKLIFETISEMWSKSLPIDLLTVMLQLTSDGNEKIEGDNTGYILVRKTNNLVSTAHLEYHCLILKEMHFERELINITHGGLGEKTGLEAANEIQERITKLRQSKMKDDFVSLDAALVSLMKHMDAVKGQELSGITTGFKNLDRITGGLVGGGMYIVAARPSVGKSAFMGKMVLGAAMKGNKVGVISLEMADEQITARLASLTTEIDFWKIYRSRLNDENEAKHFYDTVQNKMSSLPILISDTTNVDINDIKAKVSRLKQMAGIDILFVDYLQLIDTNGGNRNSNREQEVSGISRGIKLTAMEYNIPIVVLAQLNRASEQSGDKKPKLHNLRESGSLEQDADGVIFIHRDYMSGIKVNEENDSTEGEADIIVAKWRNGELTEYKIGFDGPKMKFYELPEHGLSANWQPVEQWQH